MCTSNLCRSDRDPDLNELAQTSARMFIKGGGKPKTLNNEELEISRNNSTSHVVLSQHFHFGLLRILCPSPFVIATCLRFCSHFFLFLQHKTTACSCSGCQNTPRDPPTWSFRITPSLSGMHTTIHQSSKAILKVKTSSTFEQKNNTLKRYKIL